MIRDAETRRDARAAGVEPRIIELDYALGWALRGIARHPELARRLVFKGGTCLRKCYFPNYRFSEDLDFTAGVEPLPIAALSSQAGSAGTAPRPAGRR
ncbi:MAG: nucleotidyl transferase AbiEii/AbiGii toxin family protein [Acidobacteria bacterium]|nr:nucleotidyl transferase AbiEii/AbiGii toxin family protein [Acidobacteriota bacterium]